MAKKILFEEVDMAVSVKNEKGKSVGGNIKLLQENKTTYTDIYPQADGKAKLRGHIFLSDTLPHGLCNFYQNYKPPQIVAKKENGWLNFKVWVHQLDARVK